MKWQDRQRSENIVDQRVAADPNSQLTNIINSSLGGLEMLAEFNKNMEAGYVAPATPMLRRYANGEGGWMKDSYESAHKMLNATHDEAAPPVPRRDPRRYNK